MSDKTKHIAGFSLGVMGVGFLATMPFEDGVLGLLQGGFEAGVVGGLASWFAVTALFRHPLGIPIHIQRLSQKIESSSPNRLFRC